ncbi:hypothetical protein S245_071118, partial [Arachis hypogaea]
GGPVAEVFKQIMAGILRSLAELNKGKNNSIIIRNNDTEVSSSSSELQVIKLEEKFHNWSVPLIRLIQVAAKPNFRLGINIPILMVLRDT